LLDSLPYVKMNVIHWHLTDSVSFPFQSPSQPLLGQWGAFSPGERYTTDDIAYVVEYARQRGVRMMVEIDTPAHSASFCYGVPEICPNPPTCYEPLNPATNYTFEVLADLFYDLTGGAQGKGIFPENLMHLGGDEVSLDCWTNTPSIQAWMDSMNFTADDAFLYFLNRTQQIALSYGRTVVGWEEIWTAFGTQLPIGTIIETWQDDNTTLDATSNGYRVLWMQDQAWYISSVQYSWQLMYAVEPCTGLTPSLCKNYVLGGGGAMWGETADASGLQGIIYPRLAAIAERLWSPQTITNITLAQPRYAAFRCLLNQRGIAATPSGNPDAGTQPVGAGVCHLE